MFNVKKQKPGRVSGEVTFPDIMMSKYDIISALNVQYYLSPGFITFMKTPFTTICTGDQQHKRPAITDNHRTKIQIMGPDIRGRFLSSLLVRDCGLSLAPISCR